MKIVQGLEQRSTEWHEWRRGRVMASEIPAICGVDPYKSAYDIWLEKVGLGKEQYVNADMQRGIDNESLALQLLEEKLRIKFTAYCVESLNYPWLGASLDGYHNEIEKMICEIKCPREKGHLAAKSGIIPDNYMLQMQHQLLVTGASKCYFCSYFEGEIHYIEVFPDLVVQKMILEESQRFWQRVQDFDAPEPPVVERSDPDFEMLVAQWSDTQKRKKEILKIEEELRSEIQLATQGKTSKGFGVSVCFTHKKGNVDYTKIPELKNINLEIYRKPSTTVMTIREVKEN